MSCPPEFWIWLQRTLGAGKRLNKLLDYFGDPRSLYEAGRSAWRASGVVTKRDEEKLTQCSPSESYEIMKQCADNGWQIVSYDEEAYPALLREIWGYPAVLYVWGDTNVLNAPVSVSIVGTRKASAYGIGVAQSLSYSLAAAGAVIVSGGALGVDKAAHRGAVMAGGKTVAVLGCGLGSGYLKENEKMRRVIAQNGAVVSEYLPFTPPTKQTFPIRNRLISGMTLGTVVIEAGERSGSLITAKNAAEQNRSVFAVPGDVTSSGFFGTNSLIRDGAKPVFSAMDVLDEFSQYAQFLKTDPTYKPLEALSAGNAGAPDASVSQKPSAAEKKKEQKRKKTAAQPLKNEKEKNKILPEKPVLPSYATANAAKLYAVFTQNSLLADELVGLTGLPVQDVLSALTELEMYSLVMLDSGNRYSLKTE